MTDKAYDYVVIGGGSSGSVVAGRLAASGADVLVLEAGGTDRRLDVALTAMVKNAYVKANWFHKPEPDPSRDGKVEPWAAGKVLGGGGSINSTLFVRGNPGDFDSWARAGCDGWDYESILPLYRRMETWGGGGNDAGLRGTAGPIHTNFEGLHHPLNEAFIAAAQEAGYPFNPDYNGAQQEGVAVMQVNQRRGRRSQASQEYLHRLAPRNHLTIELEADVQRIVFRGDRADAVEYVQKGVRKTCRARQEIILSGGSHISPKLLMLSGVGPAADLEALGIPVVCDSPGVGLNLQEHLAVAQNMESKVPTLNKPRSGDLLKGAWAFLKDGGGPLSVAIWQAVVFHRADPDCPTPDTMTAFGPFATHKTVQPNGTISIDVPKTYGMQVSTMYLHPRTCGRIRLRSASPTDSHVIEHDLLGDPIDVANFLTSLREARRIASQPALAPYRGDWYESERGLDTDDDWKAWMKRFVTYGIHPIGTCKMGSDELAVVDPELKVNGTAGLRVVDASVIPSLTTGNTNGPSMLVGERAADLILGR